MRVEDDSYGKSSRVGVYRVLTEEEYQSVLCDGTAPIKPETPDYTGYPMLKYKRYNDGYVKILQKKLNEFGYDLKVDGDFGAKTLKAVKAFQKKYKLKVDGIVGPITWGKLYQA